MNPIVFLSCLSFSVILGAGQLMFKLGANGIRLRTGSLLSAAMSPWLIGAIALYAAGTVLWIWILTQVELTRAYPFTLLGAALVPVAAALFLGETMPPKIVIGLLLVLAGIGLIQIS